jgi:hypothetical protein
MEVCTICGALLANDATGQRIEGHMIGKQHTGYLKIREAIEIFKVFILPSHQSLIWARRCFYKSLIWARLCFTNL